MINKPPPFKGPNIRIPIIIPIKGRGLLGYQDKRLIGAVIGTDLCVLSQGIILGSSAYVVQPTEASMAALRGACAQRA